jgi:hypothetical protein
MHGGGGQLECLGDAPKDLVLFGVSIFLRRVTPAGFLFIMRDGYYHKDWAIRVRSISSRDVKEWVTISIMG